ncbi:ChbG/HpnK family deacetylase [bacterium]|nr:MAG: ChbG/HpnK family deacetylase [bacterium]
MGVYPYRVTQLLVRGDDAGASVGTNRAIRACVAHGSIRNVSIMAVGLAFDDLVAEGSIPACCGVHAVINSEWDRPRWGPLTDAPSLTEADGTFRRFPADHQREGFDIHEVQREIEAQIAKVREGGFRPVYLDEHMGFSWLPGVREMLTELARREGLVYAPEPSVEMAVFHPSADDADTRMWGHEGLRPGQIAEERAAETAMLLSQAWPGRELVTYADLTP